MFDDVNIETILTIRKIIKSIERFMTLYIFPNTISQFLFYFFYRKYDIIDGFYITRLNLWLLLFVSLASHFSFARTVTVFNDELREKFLSSETPINSFAKKLKFLFSQKFYFAELLVAGFMYIVIPLQVLSQCFFNFFANSDNSVLAHTKALLILLPILFLLNLWAHISAFNYWHKYESHLEPKDRKKQRSKTRRNLLSTAFAYSAGGVGLMYIFPVLMNYIGIILTSWKVLLFLVCLILAFPFFRAMRALKKRRKFIKNLKKLCKEKKYKLSKIKKPYLSIFSPNKGEDFSVYIGKRRYSCKLIAATKYGTPLHIFPNATGCFLITIRFLRIELISYTKSFSYAYQAEGKKILIVNPMPAMFCTNYGAKIVELDHGDNIGEFEVYGATAFLNALDRDVIDK